MESLADVIDEEVRMPEFCEEYYCPNCGTRYL